MSTFSVITSGQVDAESPYDTVLAGQHSNNHLAIIEGDASASAHRIHPSSALSDAITTSGSQSIGASASWMPPQGFYNIVGAAPSGSTFEINISSTWRACNTSANSSYFVDGSNMRLSNANITAKTVYWQRFDG